MIKHDVPFFSQKSHISDKDWQPKGCGVTALKMIMHHWNAQNKIHLSPAIAELISHGQNVNAYIPNVGWSHRGLVNIARNFGYDGQNYDLVPAGTPPQEAFSQLLTHLEKHPVLASVHPKFDQQNKGGHIVTLTGFHNDSVLIHDPEEEDHKSGIKSLELKRFLNGWKKRYIVIYPKVK